MTTEGRTRSRRSPAKGAALMLAAGLLSWGLAPTLVLNLGALYLRGLAIAAPDAPAEPTSHTPVHVPWVVQHLPLVGLRTATEIQGVWLVARAARLLEYEGAGSAAIGCAWNPAACVQIDGRVRLSDAGHALLARAYVDSRVAAHTQLEGELLAWSCLSAVTRTSDASIVTRCRANLGRERPDLIDALSPNGLLVGQYVTELSEASGARVQMALESRAVDCRGGLRFLRQWVGRDGFRASQLAGARSLARACPDAQEAQLYLARAADETGIPAEAEPAYARSGPDRHPEAAYWQSDFLSRHGAGTPASAPRPDPVRQVFEAETLPARFENGAPMTAEAVVVDRGATHERARRAASFGAVLAHGPYIRLPYGRYRVSFFLRAEGGSLTGRLVRLDVREDSDTWRPYLWGRTLRISDLAPPGYQRFTHEFTSTGDGVFSIAVVSLSETPVYFDRVEVEYLGSR